MYDVGASDAVHWYMGEISSRVVAQTGIPNDRHHLGKLILQGLKDAPDFILQIDGATNESETCQSVLKRSIRCAMAFKSIGLKTQDVVAILGPHNLHVSIAIYAAFYTGVAAACIDMTLTIPKIKEVLSTVVPKIVICQKERASDIQQACDEIGLKANIVTFDGGNGYCSFSEFLERHGDNGSIASFKASDFDPAETIALLVSTSGTTGYFKLATITHKHLAVCVPYMWLNYDKFPTPTQKMLLLSPLQWYSALYKIVISPIVRITRIQSSLPRTIDHAYFLINKYKPTFMMTSPNLLTVLLKPSTVDRCDFSCFEIILCGGSALHENLLQSMKKISPNTQIYDAYGMTELTGLVLNFACQRPGSCGKAFGLCKYRLVNPDTMIDITEPNVPGELWVKSPGVFKGYYKDEEMTAKTLTKDGWMRTGDLMKRDENWNFYFVDRLKTMLKYNNHHISPTEIEKLIMKHPGVYEVAVSGVPDKQAGDLVVACVVPHAGYDLTAQEIKDRVKDELSDTKQIRGGVVFLKELPMTSTLKVDRQKLKSIVREALKS